MLIRKPLQPLLRSTLCLALLVALVGCYTTPDNARRKPKSTTHGSQSAWVYTTTSSQPVNPADVHLQKAWSYQAGGMLDWALKEFQLALDENPRLTKAHLGIGEIYQVKGDYNRAADAYQNAREIEPGNFDATYKLGLMYQLLDRVAESVELYLDALAINPNNPEANLNLATAYLQLGQPQLALPYAQKATRLDPESRPAYVNLGAILMALEQYDPAIDAYRAAADRGEMDPHIALALTEAFNKTERYPLAVNTLESLIQVHPGAEAYERLGYARFRMSQFDPALDAYNQALLFNAAHVGALNGRGVILMYQFMQSDRSQPDLKQQALEAWRQSIEVNPAQIRIVNLINNFQDI